MTSAGRLLETFRIRNEIADAVDEFILNEEKRLNNLKDLLHRFNATDNRFVSMIEEFSETSIEHPINSFNLMKKLVNEWNVIQDNMKYTPYEEIKEKMINMKNENWNVLDENANSTISIIGKMQQVYNFTADDVAAGLWGRIELNVTLSYEECFQIGMYFFDRMNYQLAMQWLETSIDKYQTYTDYVEDEEEFSESLLYAFAKSAFMSKNVDKSLEYLEQFKEEDKSHRATYRFEDHIRLVTNKTADYWSPRLDEDQSRCKELCKLTLNSEIHHPSSLKCRYNERSAFLKLARLKEELINADPPVRIFRDVLSDDEIELIKHLSSEKFQVSEIVTSDDITYANFDIRVSEVAFLRHNKYPELLSVLNRIDDITALKTKFGESVQVACYANGGHFIVHTDNLSQTDSTVVKHGNRIVTVLLYLNDVTLGGATVFTDLRVAVKPVKGSALVWSNVTPDGNCDIRVLHCACPVLIGEKWIFTQWLREFGQNDAQCNESDQYKEYEPCDEH